MNFRNKYLLITLRTLTGLLFVFSGASGLYSGTHGMAGVPEKFIPATQMLWDTGIFQLVKGAEVVAGLMLLTGFLPALAAIILAPICIGAVVDNLSMSPEYTPMAAIATLLVAYLGYAYWDKYKPLFSRK